MEAAPPPNLTRAREQRLTPRQDSPFISDVLGLEGLIDGKQRVLHQFRSLLAPCQVGLRRVERGAQDGEISLRLQRGFLPSRRGPASVAIRRITQLQKVHSLGRLTFEVHHLTDYWVSDGPSLQSPQW